MSYTPHHILFTPHLLDAAAVPLPYRDTQGCAGRLVNFCDLVTILEAVRERENFSASNNDAIFNVYPWSTGSASRGSTTYNFGDFAGGIRTLCSKFVPRDYTPTEGQGEWVLSDHALAPFSPDLTAMVTDQETGTEWNSPENDLRSYDHVRRMYRDLANMRRKVFSASSFDFSFSGSTYHAADGTESQSSRTVFSEVSNSFVAIYLNGEHWWSLDSATFSLRSGLLYPAVQAASTISGAYAIAFISATRSYTPDDASAWTSTTYSKHFPIPISASSNVIDTTAISGPALKSYCQECGYSGNEADVSWSATGSISHILLDIDFPTNFDDANWTWTPS